MKSLYRKNPAKYVYLWGSSPQGNIFFTKKQRLVLCYDKNPKPSENKVHIINPSFGTLGLWTFSNLTFGGYLADATRVLSVRFSSSLSCRFCLDHVRTVQFINDFRHHHHHSYPLSHQFVIFYSKIYNSVSIFQPKKKIYIYIYID